MAKARRKRELGTNPRALGTNPRALGTNPRMQIRKTEMYTEKNYKTKKALKDDVKAGVKVSYYQPNDMGFAPLKLDGTIFVEGPHYPQPHTWYAECMAKDGVIVKVVR